MVLLCDKCNEEIKKKDFIKCAKCEKFYHLDCTSIGEKMFYLMKLENRKKCLCDTCTYSHTDTKQNTSTHNSSDILTEEKDDITSMSEGQIDEYVTIRGTKISASAPDLTLSYVSIEDTDELKSEIQRLRTELEIANNEIEKLNHINNSLEKKTQDQEKIINLYKTVSIDDINLNSSIKISHMSTPLVHTKSKKQRLIKNHSENKSLSQYEDFHDNESELNKNIATTPPLETSSKLSTCRTHHHEDNKKTTKLCLISGIESNKTSTIFRSHFAEYDLCHYRMPGGSINKLSSGLQNKLKDFDLNDYCIILLGDADFTVSKNYNLVMQQLRQNLLTVQHTNVIMFGMLNVPHTSGKILRYPGPSRPRGPTFMVPPQRDRFEALKKLIRQEHVRELQRKYETEQKQELKDIAAGRGEDYVYGNFGEQEPRGLQPLQMEYPSDEPSARHTKKPPAGSRQVSQFSRYSDVMLPPVRRTFYHPYYDYAAPDYVPYVY